MIVHFYRKSKHRGLKGHRNRDGTISFKDIGETSVTFFTFEGFCPAAALERVWLFSPLIGGQEADGPAP